MTQAAIEVIVAHLAVLKPEQWGPFVETLTMEERARLRDKLVPLALHLLAACAYLSFRSGTIDLGDGSALFHANLVQNTAHLALESYRLREE